MSTKKVLLVGGGTAGHVEPALAVGRWLIAHDPSITCEFMGTTSGLESRLVPAAGFTLRTIRKAALPRKVGVAALTFPFAFAISIMQALRALRGADVLIGFGGYVSASAYVAARISRTPIVIHEANAIPGWANKLGARFARSVAIAFDTSRSEGGVWRNAILTGMPLRESISEVQLRASQRNEIISSFGLNSAKPVVLVFGGSQGAKSINSVIAATLAGNNEIQTIHAIGQSEPLPHSTQSYRPLAYIENMADAYIAADLIIARSGAVSCAEISSVGRYALLIPLPIGNGEQEANAKDLTDSGAAEICLNRDFSAEWLEIKLQRLITKAVQFRGSAHATVHASAAAAVGELAISVLQGGAR